MATIAKIGGVSWTSIAKVNGIAVASIAKVCGMDKPSGSFTPDIMLEGFEATGGSGYDNAGWVPSGTADPNYTSDVLAGSQSLLLTSGNNIRTIASAYSELYMYLVFKGTISSYSTCFGLVDASYADSCLVFSWATGWTAKSLGNYSSQAGTFGTGTYHVWIEFKKADFARIFVSTTKTKPASATAALTGSSVRNSDVKYVYLNSAGIYDQVMLNSTAIGSDPW